MSFLAIWAAVSMAGAQVARPKVPLNPPASPPPAPAPKVEYTIFRGTLISVPQSNAPKAAKDPGLRALPSALTGRPNNGPYRSTAVKLVPPPKPATPEVVGQIAIRLDSDGRLRATLNDAIWTVAHLEGSFDGNGEYSGVFEVPEWVLLHPDPLKLNLKLAKAADGSPLITGQVSWKGISPYARFEAVPTTAALPTGYFAVPKEMEGAGWVDASFTVSPNSSADGAVDAQLPANIVGDFRAVEPNKTYHGVGKMDATGWFAMVVKDEQSRLVAIVVGYLFPGPGWEGGGPAIVYRLHNQGFDKPQREFMIGVSTSARPPSTGVKQSLIRPPG